MNKRKDESWLYCHVVTSVSARACEAGDIDKAVK